MTANLKPMASTKCQPDDSWFVDILDKIDADASGSSLSGSIFRFPQHFASLSPASYTPTMLTVGPYTAKCATEFHNDLNKYKLDVAREVRRKKGLTSSQLIESIVPPNELPDIKGEYADEIELDDTLFAQVVAVDALFVAGLLMILSDQSMPEGFGSLPVDRYNYVFAHDLFLLENQVPLRVLQRALMLLHGEDEEEALRKLIFGIQNLIVEARFFDENQIEDNVTDFDLSMKKLFRMHSEMRACKHILHCFYTAVTYGYKTEQPEPIYPSMMKVLGCSELRRRGIKLEPVVGRISKVAFKPARFCSLSSSSRLYLPKLKMHEGTESLMRNLLAFELYTEKLKRVPIFASYVVLMSMLVDTVEDVQLMEKQQLIDCLGGDAESMRTLWKRVTIDTSIAILERDDKILHAISDASLSRYRRTIADIRRQTTASVAIFISVLAAAIVIVATLLQTVYTIVGYYNA